MSTTRSTTSAPRPRSRRWWVAGTVALLVIGAAAAFAFIPAAGRSAEQVPLYPVKSGPLTISVTASGSIRNSDATILRNEVEGQATILFIVDEGTMAKAGDLLVELDSSKLQDNKVDQEIKVQGDHAAFINAEEAVGITKKQGESEIKAAAVALELAILDLEKYLGIAVNDLLKMKPSESQATTDPADMAKRLAEINWASIDLTAAGQDEQGQYSQEFQEAQKKITLLTEELRRAETKYQGSTKLREKQYISQTELEADELEMKRKQLELKVAQSELRLLEKYTKRRTVAELLSEVDQKGFSLLKSQHEADSNLRDAQATLTAKDLAYKREKEKLEKLVSQISKCKLYAPDDGMVVYGTKRSRYDEPLKAGMQVYERQELIRMPKPGGMVAEVKVHESMVQQIREGLPAVISFDALGDKVFHGRVRRVAVVPDEEDRWLNPDAKSYKTEITIGQEDGALLKPGMSCTAEVVIHQYEQANYVPVQAVLRVNGEPTVYVMGENGRPEPRTVKVGLDNNRMIAIAQGLSPDERVLLNPPMPPAAKSQTSPIATAIAEAAKQVEPEPQTTKSGVGAEAPKSPQVATGDEDVTNLREKFQNMSREERQAYFQTEEGKKVMAQMRERFGNRAPGSPGGRGSAPAAPGGESSAGNESPPAAGS